LKDPQSPAEKSGIFWFTAHPISTRHHPLNPRLYPKTTSCVISRALSLQRYFSVKPKPLTTAFAGYAWIS